jgi:4-hydroxybenzoate polyprenyltransferase
MPNPNTKLAEWISAIAFAVVMFVALSLPLGRNTRSFVLSVVSVVGVGAYFYLFRDSFRGRWLKVSIAAIVGALLGGVIMFLYLHESHA